MNHLLGEERQVQLQNFDVQALTWNPKKCRLRVLEQPYYIIIIIITAESFPDKGTHANSQHENAQQKS